MEEGTQKYWLMKAEPDSRVVKGKDVKFSIDDFESVGFTPWEGVRNYEARNLMKKMTLGDKILFYHSNCKNPGITGFAEVSKEAYPDYTAWDRCVRISALFLPKMNVQASAHPYFDEKSHKDNPRWFMVNVEFVARARHFVPLSLLRHLANLPSADLPEAVDYVGEDGINAIKAMPLITRGRLSVQRVSAECWSVIHMMADKGGWDKMSFEKKATKVRQLVHETRPTTSRRTGRKRKASTSSEDEGQNPLPRCKSLQGKFRKVADSM